MDISKTDKNLAVKTEIDREGLRFYDVTKTPEMSVHGVFYDGECFRRLPAEVADKVSEGVAGLSLCTAGGRVRFVADSPFIAINTKLCAQHRMPHMAFAGSVGFDMYVDRRYHGTFMPPMASTPGYESILNVSGGEHLIEINMPLYGGVTELYIGLHENSTLKNPPEYSIKEPIVYYGSSITQGGCASRPGNSYQNIITRVLDAEQINLGFSGNAKGESEMAEYIAKLSMSAFVLDYDHNSPSPEHLRETHYPFYKTVREKNPDIPIIMLSRPKPHLSEIEKKRLEIVQESYERAKSEGDTKVWFQAGPDLISPEAEETCTVDGTHPNDSGFVSMATKLTEVLKEIFEVE